MGKRKPGPAGTRRYEIQLLDGHGNHRVDVFAAHGCRQAAKLAEIATGDRATAATLLDAGEPLQVKILGRCQCDGCGAFVMEFERWQRTNAGGLRCEDHRI